VNAQVENIAGNGSYKGTKSAEFAYSISQELQIGGKIATREYIAGRNLEIASFEYQAAALDLIRDVTIAYAEAVATKENIRITSEQKALAEDVLKSVSIRVEAAAAPLIQKTRADIERATATIALSKAKREHNIALKTLAALMGDMSPSFTLDKTAFFATAKPKGSTFDNGLKFNPDLLKLDTKLEQSKGRLDLEKAGAIPNPKLNAGMRHFQDTGDKAYMVGLSLPIPVFDSNSGNIEKAHHEVLRTELENQQAALNASSDLTQAQQRMENAYVQAKTLKTEILPSASEAFKLVMEGYKLGRFPYIDVLDMQRSLFGVQQQYIEALKDFHVAKASVERLAATHLNTSQATGKSHVR
jgi:cobalt-zinc-cadmium efflux system outer membrane protein